MRRTAMDKWHLRVMALVLCVGFAASTVYAQNAQITGTVKDSTGGVMPGATVTAKNQATGFTRGEVTDAGGTYRLPSLPPGNYSVSAEIASFGTETRPDIVLV